MKCPTCSSKLRRRWMNSFRNFFIGIRADKVFTCNNCPRLVLMVFKVEGAEDLVLSVDEIEFSGMMPHEFLAKRIEEHRRE